MPTRRKSAFKEPTVVVALIGLVGTVVTAVFAPLIIEYVKTAQVTPTAPISGNDVSGDTLLQPVNSKDYALQLLSTAKNWSLATSDPFDGNNLGWLEDSLSNETLEAEHRIESGHYYWRLKGLSDAAIHWVRPSKLDPVAGDFYVRVDTLRINDLRDIRLGIIFRDQGTRLFYDFMIYLDGHFGVRRYDGNDSTPDVTTTLTYQPSTIIQPAYMNSVAVIGVGRDYWFYINDKYVYYMTDAQFSGGTAGLIAGVKDVGQEAQITFDNFELRYRK